MGNFVWRELLSKLSGDIRFTNPATSEEITAAENALDCHFPEELRSLLKESNGVTGEYSLPLAWSIDRIVAGNREFRTTPAFRELYMPFDHLLFFGDAGNGDQFAFAILDGQVRSQDVFMWDHENDGRPWVAPSLRRHLEGVFSGKIA
jgi:hypothetical protein